MLQHKPDYTQKKERERGILWYVHDDVTRSKRRATISCLALTLTARGSTLRRQNLTSVDVRLTSKVDLRTVRVNIFPMAVDP